MHQRGKTNPCKWW